jgi:hypothetical protein
MQLEILALRHQLAIYQNSVKRPQLQPADRFFWAWFSRLWSGWQHTLEIVQPRTVLAWQKKRFRDYWRCLSQSSKPGRPTISKEVIDLIRDMWRSNPTWGSPRIVGELRKLGITMAKSIVEKYRPRIRKPPSPTWRAFLANHVKDIVACDFFIVPTVQCRVLFVFIILAHERRRIIHFNITEHPTAQWTAQQIVEAFPWDTTPRYLLRDRDSIMVLPSSQGARIWESKKSKWPPKVLGKTHIARGSLEAYGETRSIMSSYYTRGICAVFCAPMWTTITTGERISRWRWMCQSRERFTHLSWGQSRSCQMSVAYTIMMSESRPNRVENLLKGL